MRWLLVSILAIVAFGCANGVPKINCDDVYQAAVQGTIGGPYDLDHDGAVSLHDVSLCLDQQAKRGK